MNADIALATPQHVGLAALGPRARAIATTLAAVFPTAHQPSSASATDGPPATTATCYLAIITPDEWTPATLAELLAAAPVRCPRWLAVLGATATDVRQLDEALDELPDGVDALIVVADTDAASLALEAWIRLRHDAPARAFADWRDAEDRACRVAAIVAAAPAAMPPAAAHDRPSDGGHLAAHRIQAAATHIVQAAGARCASQVPALASTSGADLATALAGAPHAAADLDIAKAAAAAVADVDDDPHVLGAVLDAAEDLGATALPPANLEAATMAVVAADAAFTSEASRTGLASKLGRKKRLADLSSARAAALAAWTPLAQAAAEAEAQVGFSQHVHNTVAPRLEPARRASALAADADARLARDRWLTTAVRLVDELSAPITIDPAALSPSWGIAAPGIRRHLLLPTEPQISSFDPNDGQPPLLAAPGDAHGVVLHTADDLARPLAAVLLIGVPAAAVITNEPAIRRAATVPTPE